MKKRNRFKENKLLTLFYWMIATLLLAFSGELAIKFSAYFSLLNIEAIVYCALGIMIIKFPQKPLNAVCISFMFLNGILSFGKFYLFEHKHYLRLHSILFALSALYLIGVLIHFYICHKKYISYDKNKLLNGIIPFLYIGFSFCIHLFRLEELIETEFHMPLSVLGFAAILSVSITILSAILIKNRKDKVEYFGKLIGIFFAVFILVFGTPIMVVTNTNYIFDKSVGEPIQSIVTEKDSSYRRRSGSHYYLTLQIDGEEIDMEVEKVVYICYDVGDTITLYKHEGALRYPYYEYRMESIYKYPENEK